MVIDLDATLIAAHPGKQDATRTWKTFGFHPLLGFVDHGAGGMGEPVAELLRPGRAGSNTAVDHVQVCVIVAGVHGLGDTGGWPPTSIMGRRYGRRTSRRAPRRETRSAGRGDDRGVGAAGKD